MTCQAATSPRRHGYGAPRWWRVPFRRRQRSLPAPSRHGRSAPAHSGRTCRRPARQNVPASTVRILAHIAGNIDIYRPKIYQASRPKGGSQRRKGRAHAQDRAVKSRSGCAIAAPTRLEAAPDVLRAAPSAPAGRRRPQLSQRPAGRDSPRRAESGAAGRGAPSVRADRTAVRRRLKGQLAPSRRRGPHRSSQARVRALPRLRARPRVQGSAGACAPRRRAGRRASGTRGIFLPPRQAGADTSSAGAAWRAAGRAAPRRPSPGSCRSGSSRVGGRRAAKMPRAPYVVRPRSARAVRAPEADIHRAAAPAAHAVAAALPSIGYSAPQASGPGRYPL